MARRDLPGLLPGWSNGRGRKELDQQKRWVVDAWRDHCCGATWIPFKEAEDKKFATYGQGQQREREAALEVERTVGPFAECMTAAYAAHGLRTQEDHPRYFFGGQAERDAGLMK